MSNTSIGVGVITYRSKRHLKNCLTPLLQSPLSPKVMVVDASSKDGTLEVARLLGAQAVEVPYESYNHGATREWTRKKLGTDIVVLMTPDAYLTDPEMLKRLVQPLIEGKASLAYGRQLPRRGARAYESFAREFNYPRDSHYRSIEDKNRFGSYLFFCSNSFAAYSNLALDAVGGFPEVLLGEDTLVCAKLLQAGHRVAYVAEATVRHSHNYGLKQEFQRHFDTGLMRQEYRHLFGDDTSRGREYAKCLLKSLPLYRLPYALLHLGAKWLGYRLGQRAKGAPLSVKKAFSSQKFYWKANDVH